MKALFNLVKIPKYTFSFNNNKIFFKEPLPFHFNTIKAHPVPADIPRPDYLLSKDFDYEAKSYARHESKEEIDKHRLSCKITADVLQKTEDFNSSVGFKTTEEIDLFVHKVILSHNAYPTAIGYMGFPKSVCTSVNEIVVHGIPNTRQLLAGDSINVDVTNFKHGYHGDSSIMLFVDKPHDEVERLSKATREAMYKAISYCKPGEKVSTIGKVINDYMTKKGYTVIREFCGHGVGKQVHMEPYVYHLPNKVEDVMQPGMTFTIEPVCCLKPYKEIFILEDQWSIILSPDNPSAQWEHTILITNDGYEILTFREKEKLPVFDN